MATKRKPKLQPGKCRRCRVNPVKAPARICADCIRRSRARRSTTSAGSSFRSRGGAAGVLARSAASFPVANGSFYEVQRQPGDDREPAALPTLEVAHGR